MFPQPKPTGAERQGRKETRVTSSSSNAAKPNAAQVTEDGFLGGRLTLFQPHGYGRAGIDAAFLAAAVPAEAGERALELGSGAGAAGLCLARRVEGATVQGLELQPELVALARRNAERNGLADRARFAAGDLRDRPESLRRIAFDHVLMNPPYHPAETTRPSPIPMKAAAHAELAGDLADWIGFGLARLRPRGALTLIHQAERLGEILGLLEGPAGELRIFPLWPRPEQPAKRVLVRARKGSAAPLRLLPGLILHRESGGFTDEAEAVLRHGAALDWGGG